VTLSYAQYSADICLSAKLAYLAYYFIFCNSSMFNFLMDSLKMDVEIELLMFCCVQGANQIEISLKF